jgi:hypothetical protein
MRMAVAMLRSFIATFADHLAATAIAKARATTRP